MISLLWMLYDIVALKIEKIIIGNVDGSNIITWSLKRGEISQTVAEEKQARKI